MSHHKIICGKAEEVLPEFDDNMFDLIVTDPPYNIGKDFENETLNHKDFYAFHYNYLIELKRVIKKNKPILIFFNTGENLSDYFQILHKVLKFKKFITVYKPNDCSFPLNTVLRTSEALLLCSREDTLVYKSEKYIHDVLIANHGKKENFYHPAVKNLQILLDVISAFSLPNDLLLDCFVGSGTSLVGGERLKRNSVGIDIEKEYCELSYNRLKKEIEQDKLFDKLLTKSTIEKIGF